MKIHNRVLLVALFAAAVPAFADTIVVPNGNFTNSANNGEIGGTLIGSGSGTIGSGPWGGTYNGIVAGLLLAPELTINDQPGGGTATISGVAGVNVLGNLLDNSGWFQQDLGAGNVYLPNTVYTLSAVVDADALLSISALDSYGAGIALLNGGNVLASTTNPGSALVNISLFGVNPDDYQITLSFTTGAVAPTGNIGIRLYDDPSGLATANVLQSLTFSNVNLTDSPVGGNGGSATPEPSECVLTGLAMILMVSGWRYAQRKRGMAAWARK